MIIQWSNQTSQVRLYMPHWRSWNQCLNQQPFLVPSKPRAHWCCALKNQEFPKKTQIINLINQSQMPVWISGFRRIFLPLSGVKRAHFCKWFHWWRLFIWGFPTGTSWEELGCLTFVEVPNVWGGFRGGQLGSFLRWISPTIVVARISPPMTPVDHLWN